jgi:hypothetical protein
MFGTNHIYETEKDSLTCVVKEQAGKWAECKFRCNTNCEYFVDWLLTCTAARRQHSKTKHRKNFIPWRCEAVKHLMQYRMVVIKMYMFSLFPKSNKIKLFLELCFKKLAPGRRRKK